MKDLYDREILVGDRCIRYSGWTSTLEEVIVLGEDEKGIKILNTFDKEVYTTGEKLLTLMPSKGKFEKKPLSIP